MFCLLAEDNDIACGYITYSLEFSLFTVAEYVRVNSLFVQEDYRGQGIGKLLLNSVKDIAKGKGCPSVQCFTPDFNNDAINFYKEMGANTKNAVRFYFDTGI